jgi:hypothetical protein
MACLDWNKSIILWHLDHYPYASDENGMVANSFRVSLFMHYTAGLILSLTFQLAHVIEDAEMPLPDKETGNMKNTWAIHQLLTTVNFSTKNRFINWFTGGLKPPN